VGGDGSLNYYPLDSVADDIGRESVTFIGIHRLILSIWPSSPFICPILGTVPIVEIESWIEFLVGTGCPMFIRLFKNTMVKYRLKVTLAKAQLLRFRCQLILLDKATPDGSNLVIDKPPVTVRIVHRFA
jgi:hypothetical protein